jgi:hypothetical protein
MTVIEYAEHGSAVTDFNFRDWLYNVKHNLGKDARFIVSTSVAIHAVRLAIARDEIPAEEIVFQYFGHGFQANEYGAILEWPRGFADVENALAEDILRAAMRKRRIEKNTS